MIFFLYLFSLHLIFSPFDFVCFIFYYTLYLHIFILLLVFFFFQALYFTFLLMYVCVVFICCVFFPLPGQMVQWNPATVITMCRVFIILPTNNIIFCMCYLCTPSVLLICSVTRSWLNWNDFLLLLKKNEIYRSKSGKQSVYGLHNKTKYLRFWYLAYQFELV